MDESIPSLIVLMAFIVPIAIFLRGTTRLSAAKMVHAVMMAVICLAMGLLLSAAVIKFVALESQLLIATLVLIGSVLASMIRILWIKRFS